MKSLVGTTYSLSAPPRDWPLYIGVYKLTCLENGLVYIGKSRGRGGFRARWNSHRSDFRRGVHDNEHMQRAFRKYGESSFEFEIIEICQPDQNLLERESFWINYFNSMKEGFNIRDFVYKNGVLRERIYKPTPFELISPNGDKIEGEDLNLFADQNNLNSSSLRRVIRGKDYSHKGYKSTNPELWRSERFYTLISPSKQVYTFSNLTEFCQQNGLPFWNIWSVIHFHRLYCKGWHVPNLEEEKQRKVDHYIRVNSPFRAILESGEEISAENLGDYCKENNLVPNIFCDLLDGKKKAHNGLVLKKNQDSELYCLKSPTDELVYFSEIKSFCREYNINDFGGVSKVIKGERRDIRGWTLKDTELLKTPKYNLIGKYIQQINVDTGDVLNIFENLSSASRHLRGRPISSVIGKISSALSKDFKDSLALGFYWRKCDGPNNFEKFNLSII